MMPVTCSGLILAALLLWCAEQGAGLPPTAADIRATILDDCAQCFDCLQLTTGQDTGAACTQASLGDLLECSAQIKYLYPTGDSALPCADDCTSCVAELELETSIIIPRPALISWDRLYPSMFYQDISMGDDGPETTEGVTADGVTAALPGGGVVKRSINVDGDACCDTSRSRTRYDVTYTTTSGQKWYPVWFRNDLENVPFSYQFYELLTCSYVMDSCVPNLQCRTHTQKRTFLMSTLKPDPLLGHVLIIMTHPSDYVKYIDVNVPSYCKCVKTV